MSGAIDTVNAFLGANPSGPASAAFSAQASLGKTVEPSVAEPLRNPQVIQDPAAGFITQYVNASSGQVIAQTPSAVVVAYLRQGLSADGMEEKGPGEIPVAKSA